MRGNIIKEHTIIRSQKLDLLYSQSRMLYEIFSDATREEMDPIKSKPRLHVDGMMGTMENVKTNQLWSQTGNMSLCFNMHVATKVTVNIYGPTQYFDVLNMYTYNPKGTL